jgi:hypothetical protein
MKGKTITYHWYPDKHKPGRKRGFPKTACGRDGSDVGGLITGFFVENLGNDNHCGTCVRIYKRRNSAKK